MTRNVAVMAKSRRGRKKTITLRVYLTGVAATGAAKPRRCFLYEIHCILSPSASANVLGGKSSQQESKLADTPPVIYLGDSRYGYRRAKGVPAYRG